MRAGPICRAALALWCCVAVIQHAQAADDTVCNQAIAVAERQHAVPTRVLGTIAAVESGRPIGRKLVPWPWAINAEGVGHFYATKAEAVAAVQALRASGTRSIDVGCLQINLAAHPQAFDSLEAAFDPAANASYAARFLRSLEQQTGRLAVAMTAYHSHTPEFAADYARRLLAVWPEAAALGLRADPPVAAADRRAPDRRTASNSKIAVVSLRGAGWPAPNAASISTNRSLLSK